MTHHESTVIDSSSYTKGSFIWLPCSTSVWVKGVLLESFTSSSDCLHVSLENGLEQTIPRKDIAHLPYLCNPEFLTDTNDLTTLSYLHEPDVLFSLKCRFVLGHIYTYCGIVLVAINPYCSYNLYGSNVFSLYRNASVRQLDPHVYAIAEEAYVTLLRFEKSQSIIISGESGAGKTVSAKHVMQYLAEACNSRSVDGRSSIEKKVLASNPITEAFGNAKTVRNDNSSRFGKFLRLNFSNFRHITGANMKTYLLEKSRVIGQTFGERNYHIFYQMSSARNNFPILHDLYLDTPSNFAYLNSSGKVFANEIQDDLNDLEKFNTTLDALHVLGLDNDLIRQMFSILSGILHLGNINFGKLSKTSKSNDLVCELSDDDNSKCALSNACKLLLIKEEELTPWLRYKHLKAGSETVKKNMTCQQAINSRDSTSKLVYSRLFDWIVDVINKSLIYSDVCNDSKVSKFIGVLDIYGFEIFDCNSFEQLCINYANEMLQQQFNQHVFKLEQAEYVKEGIKWSFIDFTDNQACLDLIENRLGILDILAQECKLAKSSDNNFLLNLSNPSSLCCNSQHFVLPRICKPPGEFIVKHFAGDVRYYIDGFTEKNMDAVNRHQMEVLASTKLPLLAILLEDFSPTNSTGLSTTPFKKCLASQFKQSLHDLRDTLNSTTPHYIRCIKPNDLKRPSDFNPQRTVEQLRACGVLETIRISAAGYPSRWSYEEFRSRYRMLSSSSHNILTGCQLKSFALHICNSYLQQDKYEFGHTKIFFRTGQVALLESARTERMRSAAVLIQKIVRGVIQRKKFCEMLNAIAVIKATGRAWMAYRRLKFIQMHRACIIIQKNVRAYIYRRKFCKLRQIVLTLQRKYREKSLLKARMEENASNKFILLQACCRGLIVRERLKRETEAAVIIQKWIRRFLACRLLRHLKIEARSVSHLEYLNKNLKNKVIELQQRLDIMTSQNKELEKENGHLRLEFKVTSLRPRRTIYCSKKCVESIDERDRLQKQLELVAKQFSLFESEVVASKSLLDVEVQRLNKENASLKKQMNACYEIESCTANVVALRTNHCGYLKLCNIQEFLNFISNDFNELIKSSIPVMPSFLIFMSIRWLDNQHDLTKIDSILRQIDETVREEINKAKSIECFIFWLSNVWRLMQLFRQYSGDKMYEMFNTIQQAEYELNNFDSSNFQKQFCGLVAFIYKQMIEKFLAKLFTQAKIVSFVLTREHHSTNRSKVDANFLLNELNKLNEEFQKCGVDWALSSQIFHHLFDYIEAHAFNVLMSRRDLCNFNHCTEIRHNIQIIQQWARDKNILPTSYEKAVQPMYKLIQVVNLLQARKTEADLPGINDICPSLSISQIVKFLTAYCPTESYEPKITPSFLQKLRMHLKLQRDIENDNQDGNNLLCLPTVINPVIAFPYVQSNLLLKDVQVPQNLSSFFET